MKPISGAALPVALLILAPALAHAQQAQAVAFQDREAAAALAPAAVIQAAFAVQDPYDKPEEQMGTSGFFLGIVGMLAGAAIGSQIGQEECPPKPEDKGCVGRHAYTGALVAGTLLVPVGVHMASRPKGNLLVSLGLSAATGAAAYYGFKAIPGSPVAMAPFVAVPLQVFTSVKVESRRR